VKVEPRTLLYYKSFRTKKEAGSYKLDTTVKIADPNKDTLLLPDTRFAFCIHGLKETNGSVRMDPIIIYGESREDIDLWRRAVREACGKTTKKTERKKEENQQGGGGAAIADSIKVFFSTSGFLLSQLPKNNEACADALMLADRATDAQIRVVYNIMASDRMKLSSLRPLPEFYVFGAVVLRALSEIGPIFPDEALVEWLRLFRAYSRSDATSKSKSIRSQQAIQVSTLLKLLPLKSMVLLEALFSFLNRSSTSSQVLTALDTANLIKKYAIPKYPEGIVPGWIDTKLWHKGMRRMLYLLLSNYDEIFSSSSMISTTSSTMNNRTKSSRAPQPLRRREEEEEYEIESKRKEKKKKKVRFKENEEDHRGVELQSTTISTRKEEEEEEEEEKIDVPHSSSEDEEEEKVDEKEKRRIERMKEKVRSVLNDDDNDDSSDISDLDEQHVFFSDSEDGSDSDDETLRMMKKNVPIDLDNSHNEKDKRVAAREKWKREQEESLRKDEEEKRRIEMESRRQREREEEMERERERIREREEENARKRIEIEKERQRREKKEEERIRQENNARIRQAALKAKENRDRREKDMLTMRSKRSSFNDISTIDFEYSKERAAAKEEHRTRLDNGQQELFDMVEREKRQEKRILEAKKRRDEAKRAHELAALARKRIEVTNRTTRHDEDDDTDTLSSLRERMDRRDRARAKAVSRIWERVRQCNALASKARDVETVQENRKALRVLMEEIEVLKVSTKPETSLQVMLGILEENINLSLNLYDYREDIVERTRIKQRQFLEQFNSSLVESPVPSASRPTTRNSPPSPVIRSSGGGRGNVASTLSVLTSRLWSPQQQQQRTQQQSTYDDDDADDDGAW